MTNLPKFRRIRTLNNDPNVSPRYRAGFEFWGTFHEDGYVVEEHSSFPHQLEDLIRLS